MGDISYKKKIIIKKYSLSLFIIKQCNIWIQEHVLIKLLKIFLKP